MEKLKLRKWDPECGIGIDVRYQCCQSRPRHALGVLG